MNENTVGLAQLYLKLHTHAGNLIQDRASCLMLEINSDEAKIEESEREWTRCFFISFFGFFLSYVVLVKGVHGF